MAKKVRPVPKGYQTVTTSLTVSDADGFIKFCKKAFGATELLRMKGPGGSIMHAEIQIGDARVMVSDEMPGMGKKSAKSLGGSALTLFMYVPDCDAVAGAQHSARLGALPPLDRFL